MPSTRVIQLPNSDLAIEIDSDVLSRAELKVGDIIEWSVLPDGTVSLNKFEGDRFSMILSDSVTANVEISNNASSVTITMDDARSTGTQVLRLALDSVEGIERLVEKLKVKLSLLSKVDDASN